MLTWQGNRSFFLEKNAGECGTILLRRISLYFLWVCVSLSLKWAAAESSPAQMHLLTLVQRFLEQSPSTSSLT